MKRKYSTKKDREMEELRKEEQESKKAHREVWLDLEDGGHGEVI